MTRDRCPLSLIQRRRKPLHYNFSMKIEPNRSSNEGYIEAVDGCGETCWQCDNNPLFIYVFIEGVFENGHLNTKSLMCRRHNEYTRLATLKYQ